MLFSATLLFQQSFFIDYTSGYHMEMTKTADTSSGNSPFGALIAMFYEPTKAFGMLTPRRYGWLPLVLIMLTSFILLMWYFNVVDFAWLSDQMNASIKDAAAREQASQMMTKGIMQGMTVGGALVGIPMMTALMGVYFMIVAKSISKEFGFYEGFSLAAWSYVPALLGLPLGIIQIMLSPNAQFGMSELNPLSLNSLVFHYPMSHSLAGWLDMINVTSLWGVVLMIIGFQVWAKVSRATAMKVVLIPYITILGGWLAIALAMSKAA
jgi:hypothetical protein